MKELITQPKVIAFLSVWLAIFLFCSILSGTAYPIKDIPVATTTAAPVTTPAPDPDKPAQTTPAPIPPKTEEPAPPKDDPYEKLTYSADNSRYFIYLDAGHGWSDPGVVVNENAAPYVQGVDTIAINEKDINLAITKKVKKALEKMGYTVGETRPGDLESDCPVALSEYGMFNVQRRIGYINSKNPDYCISIHCNSLDGSPSTKGTRVYHYKGKTASEKFTDQMVSTLSQQMGTKVTKHTNNFAITRDATMPAILIEAGFMTSPVDLANLTDPDWQDQFACAIALGMEAYIRAGN